MSRYKILTTLITLTFNIVVCGQITVTSNTMTVEQYVQNVLVGAGVTISNVQYNGGSANVTIDPVSYTHLTLPTILLV